MYDGIPHEIGFWSAHYGLKIVNFSKTLHDKLVSWGLDSIYVQYFPEPQAFISGNWNEVFFWQRISKMNINVIKELLDGQKFKIHLHRAVDPYHQFVQPSAEDEKKFGIIYSDWFETKDEMRELIKQKGIYIAPREYEGIGMSFLEAMAMGKAVVAVNNPTMNEYIEHGKTGYLFDLSKPEKIDFSSIEQVQKNAYRHIQKGFARWEKSKHRIIDFVEKP